MAVSKKKSGISLKMFVDTKSNKVVFAEAGKKFVDFIFQIPSLPLSCVLKLLKENNGTFGSIESLYQSMESLDDRCFEPNIEKDSVLRPRASVVIPLLSFYDVPKHLKLHRCGKHEKISDSEAVTCPDCAFSRMPPELDDVYVPPSKTTPTARYVKEEMPYMVMDNLEVKPMSASLIKSFVKNFDSLEEKEVQIGRNEGLAILKASLESQAVLSTVFLAKKKECDFDLVA